MPNTPAIPEFLIRQSDEALRNAHARAMGASAVHQARGAFYFAELCENRATEILAILDSRASVAA